MTATAAYYVEQLGMLPHPEGGYFRQTYLSPLNVQTPRGERPVSTAIYYLLEQGDYSAFHTLKSDECWHFYAGGPLLLHIIYPSGEYACITLNGQLEQGGRLQYVVPAHTWFAAEPAPGSTFSLAGCTVSPGFVFDDFELARKASLSAAYPSHAKLISRLCRD